MSVAQGQLGAYCELSPEMEEELEDPPSPHQNPCFDRLEIIENCTQVYVRVNVHFLLDDACEGNLAAVPNLPENLSPSNAFFLAEKLIDDANTFYDIINDVETGQWNQQGHGVTVTQHQCIPFRYILTGVYIHCRSAAQLIQSLSFTALNGLYVNNESEINVFFTNIGTIQGSNPNGFASHSLRRVAVENNSPGLFNHELGHIFSLAHTFNMPAGDGCDDTWAHSWSWDAGQCDLTGSWISACDGHIETSGANGCWGSGSDYLYSRPPPCQFSNADPCDVNLFCSAHPCCLWQNQNNNIMCYSKWAINPIYATLTPCQVERCLISLSGSLCPYIEQVGGDCPPPRANIGVVPMDGVANNDCFFCVHLEASMNDRYYKLEIKEAVGGGSMQIVAQTGWVDGPVGKYCIFLYQSDKNRHLGVQPGGEYLFELTVENECGQVHQKSEWIQIPPDHPTCNPAYSGNIELTAYPNPTTGMLNISYTLHDAGEVQMYLIEAFTMQRIDLLSTPNASIGTYFTSISLSGYYNGIFFLVYRLDEELHIQTILKT